MFRHFSVIIREFYNRTLLCYINSKNLKLLKSHLCKLARHKYKTPWWWHRNIETYSSIYYIKRCCCDIYCFDVIVNMLTLIRIIKMLSTCIKIFKKLPIMKLSILSSFTLKKVDSVNEYVFYIGVETGDLLCEIVTQKLTIAATVKRLPFQISLLH
jgi:hypothetical protein